MKINCPLYRGVRIRHHAQNKKKKGGRKMMSFAEVIELDNQFDRFLFEGGNDPFGKDTDYLLAPEKE